MRAPLAFLLISCACLLAAGAVSASGTGPRRSTVTLPWSGLSVGVNDDSGKLASFRDWLYPTMAAEGLRLDTITIQWDESDPFAIPAQGAVGDAIAAAQANGIAVELDLYPLHSRALTRGQRCRPSTDPTACGSSAGIDEFAGWTAQVAAAFPSVHQFVVMNECNQPLFLNPQWDSSGANQSAEVCGRALAAAYDALKGANRVNFVWGVGLSPRGNDNARAAVNSSTSPVRFIGSLGAWFTAFARKTHRTAPLMDGFDFHPYPVPQSLSFARGYPSAWDASVTNLSRIYQAFYGAFAGSPQRTIGAEPGGGLPVSLNETGIQTTSAGADYYGLEVSATQAGGVLGRWATQAYQARWYLGMLDDVACDADVRLVNIFHLVDETDLAGWQSGLFFADETPKLSAATVAAWVPSTAATCAGRATAWRPGATLTLPVLDLAKLKLPTTPFLPPVLATPSSLEAPAAAEQSPLAAPADPAQAPTDPAAADPPPAGDSTNAAGQPPPAG